MTKKAVATKSTGKGRNAEPSSSSAAVLDKASKKKGFLAERGFVAENQSPGFVQAVTALGWGNFVKHRKQYILSLVRDFYDGIPPSTDGKPVTHSIVRGERVNFDPRTINDYYGLGYFGKAIELKHATFGKAEMDEVKARVCTEDAVWEKSDSEFKLLKKYLCEEANMWFSFIRHSLLPTSHTLYVEKERLLVIDAIMTGDKIEVGKLICKEINKCKNKKEGYFTFPCLITDLCIAAEVEIDAGEEREDPIGAFPTKFRPRQRATGATAPADSLALQRLLLHQESLARFVKDQYEWQKQMFAQLTKGKTTVEAPQFPDWIIEDENEPLASMQAKAVKKEKAKRMRSPAKKKESPAKKKKKISSEEEDLKSDELDSISEPDEEETLKVAQEVNSDEESEETLSEEGSSSEKTDIECDPQPSPPLQTTTIPQQSQPSPPAKEKSPHPSKQKQDQPSQQSAEIPATGAIAVDAVAVRSLEPVTATGAALTKKMKIKHTAKRQHGPSKQQQQEESQQLDTEESDQQPASAIAAAAVQEPREKLKIRRNPAAQGGRAAPATSGVFKPPVAVAAANQDVPVVVSTDAIADDQPEQAPEQGQQQTYQQDPAADEARQEAENEAAAKLAELQANKKKAAAAEVTSVDTSSGATAATSDDPTKNKKKEKKKKGTQVAQRASSRLRSGAI